MDKHAIRFISGTAHGALVPRRPAVEPASFAKPSRLVNGTTLGALVSTVPSPRRPAFEPASLAKKKKTKED